MPGLLDIAISSRTVSIGESEVPVYGVSAKGIAVLFERFPIFREMFSGRTPDLSPEAVTKLAPEAVAAIIAAGTGTPGNREAEAKAEQLPAGTQAELLEAIMELTMPKGFGPFVESVVRMFNVVSVESTNIPATK